MVNHIRKCSKQSQKEYKTRHDWIGKVIHRGMCKLLKFDNTTQQHLRKPKFILENETNKIPGNFEIQTDHSIPAKKLVLVLTKKKKIIYHHVDFKVKIKNKNKKSDEYLDLGREQKKMSNMKVTIVADVH